MLLPSAFYPHAACIAKRLPHLGTVAISLILVRETTGDGNGHAVPRTIKSVGTGHGGIQTSRPVGSERILKINESETVPPTCVPARSRAWPCGCGPGSWPAAAAGTRSWASC